ncbi:MAG TPA: HlyD family secretion protein [Opitutaceae bacterium]|nr:HlyD family secretion protein [Opitutaceae bacterium]
MKADDSSAAADRDDAGRRARRPRRPLRRRPLLAGGIILGVIVLAVALLLVWRHTRRFESTDDAFIDVASEQVGPQVAGRVLRVLVDDNQDVTAGQPLVELDPADYRNRLEQAQASAAQAEAQAAQDRAQVAVVSAQIEQARANEATAQADADNAARDLRRYQGLRQEQAGAVSAQQLDRATTANSSAAARLRAAQAAVAAAEAQSGYARSQVQAAQAAISSARAQIDEAKLMLSYTVIRARLSGRVATKTVAVGDYVTPGTPLLAVVPPQVYVTANFKETQLNHLRPGQTARIRIDSYPDFKANGRVQGVQASTGQAFSILPAENATGNWVKVVQRVPVKILLDRQPDDPGWRLAPGMSVEVRVQVR